MGYKDTLEKAGFALRDKVGRVLSSGSEILALRERAANYRATENSAVNAQAEAVYAKATGLLTNYKSIEGESVSLLGKANAMQEKMATDPLWLSIQAGNYQDVLGWAALNRAKDYIGEATSLTQQLYAVASRADAHLAAVAQLRSDLASVENFAQGKGVKAALTGALSFGSQYLSFAKYAAIGVGLFFVWDIAKPLIVARKVARR